VVPAATERVRSWVGRCSKQTPKPRSGLAPQTPHVGELDWLHNLVHSVRAPDFAGIAFHEVLAKSELNHVPKAAGLPFNWTGNPHRGCSHGCLCYPEVPGTERDAGTSPTSQGQAVCVVAISAHQDKTTGGLRIEHIPAPCPDSRGSPRCATDDHGTNTRADASHSSQSVGLKISQTAHCALGGG
jgi:hypothetical protein